MLYYGFNGGRSASHYPLRIMFNETIATAFFDLSSNELWEEYLYLQSQSPTREVSLKMGKVWKEICTREERRNAMEDLLW